MKKFLALLLTLVFAWSGSAFSETNIADAVQQAYNDAINADGDGDVKYNELYEITQKVISSLKKGDRDSVKEDCILLFGDIKIFANQELIQKAEGVLEYVIEPDGDKLSALMCKLQKMRTVSGTIEPTKISIEVKDLSDFVTELRLSPKAVGYVLAMLDIYDYSWLGGEKFLQFTKTGFTYQWTAVGDYKLNLSADFTVKKTAEIKKRSNFGFTIDEFILDFHMACNWRYFIAESDGSYNLYDFNNYKLMGSFSFETDNSGNVTNISVKGQNMAKYGQKQLYSCVYAFSVVHPELDEDNLINEFKRVCGTGEIYVEDGISYTYLESRALNVLWFTMKIDS